MREWEFNRIDEEGWELCGDHGGTYTFKRPEPGTGAQVYRRLPRGQRTVQTSRRRG